jgi:L-asparagine transporter-like permease
MGELLKDQVSKLRHIYKKNIIIIIIFFVVTMVIRAILPESPELPKNYVLMSKSVLIILFLISIPLVLSYLKQKVRNIPPNIPLAERFSVYTRYFRIKSLIFLILALLTLLVFTLSGDPMLLVLLVAVVLFFYFERPNRLKIQEDLKAGGE